MATMQTSRRSTSQVQLRRKPPVARRLDPSIPALRLVKAPKITPIKPRGWRRLGSFDSASVRIVAGLLLVSIPTSLLLGYVVSRWSTQTLVDQILKVERRFLRGEDAVALKEQDEDGEKQYEKQPGCSRAPSA